jgi:hypothetical protein
MAFEWNRMHKWEDRIESEITDSVFDYVFEYYGVSELGELTEENIHELEEFRNVVLNEYSPFQIGFSNLISQWESETWENGFEDE